MYLVLPIFSSGDNKVVGMAPVHAEDKAIMRRPLHGLQAGLQGLNHQGLPRGVQHIVAVRGPAGGVNWTTCIQLKTTPISHTHWPHPLNTNWSE